jgi:hypothetical protein
MAGWFPEPAGLPTALGDHAAVLDGEVVAVDPEGRPSFETLQQRAWCRRPGGGSGSCWPRWLVDESPFAEPAASLLGGRGARPGADDPAPVFVRPELAVEVSFLGGESAGCATLPTAA